MGQCERVIQCIPQWLKRKKGLLLSAPGQASGAGKVCCWLGPWMDGWTDGWMDGWMDGRMSQAEMKIVGHVEKNASLLFTFFSIIPPIFLSTKNQCGQAE